MDSRYAIIPGFLLVAIVLTFISTAFIPLPQPISVFISESDQSSPVNFTLNSISSKFPAEIQQWQQMILQHSTKNHLDPNLVAAVMLRESSGDPQAYSSSGAVGLMQVMPRDGLASSFTCNGKPCFASRPDMQTLFDPNFNIEYGVRLLAGLMEKTGSLKEALRAYGPMDVGYAYADFILDTYAHFSQGN